jgi:hypothetical protein
MTSHRITSAALVTSLAAFALAIAACRTDHRVTTAAQTTSTTSAPTAATTQPVSLTGCLQEGKRGTYILTEVNTPQQPDSSNAVVVAREKLTAAEEAYVLSSNTAADLQKLVGGRVHVEGTVTRPFDVPGRQAKTGGESAATAGQTGDVKAIESGRVINEKDLALVHVTSLQKVANTCGSHAAG